MLRKIFGLLIFPILGASVHTYAQEEYDQQIFQYINQGKNGSMPNPFTTPATTTCPRLSA